MTPATTWAEALTAWATWLRAAGRPDSTVGLRTYHLRRLAAAVDVGPWEVTGDDVVEWMGAQAWAPETRRATRSSVRGFYRWAVATGRTDVDPSAALAPVRPTPPHPRPAPDEAVAEALAARDPRVPLMVALAAGLGMRRAEVAAVHACDLHRSPWGWALEVHGKGGRTRTVPVPDPLAAALREACAAPGADGWAFPSSRTTTGHLSPRWVGRLVSRALPGDWTMHALRHRFATRAYAVDTDLLTVQQLLGHASPETTRRYVVTPDDALRRTVLAVA